MQIADGIHARSFHGRSGGAEHFITVDCPSDLGFEDQVALVEAHYDTARRKLNLPPGSAVFRRLFLSDTANQVSRMANSRLLDDDEGPVAVSVVRQPPLSGAKLALMAYHVEGGAPMAKTRLSPNHIIIDKNGLAHLWSTRLCAKTSRPEDMSATAQTKTVLNSVIDELGRHGGNLRDNCHRTWIYLKNVDLFYRDMVRARTDLFTQHGLTADSHYIASTGIEGACSHQYDVVSLDAYSLLGGHPDQVSFLNAFEHMCATKDYEVTFERATRLAYADRAHIFVSGTASIDHEGKVLHLGDVIAQTDRALENVEALLVSADAGLDDMMHWIVYLRDIADRDRVAAHLAKRLPGQPVVLVQGAVCRPEWLVEIEGVAVAPADHPHLPGY